MLFCTIDVKALYPSIPYDGGLRAIEKALESRGDKSVSTKSLLNLAEIVLKNNYFEHNGKTYVQRQETATRNKFAPPYATLFMGDFEEEGALGDTILVPGCSGDTSTIFS